MHWAQLLKQSSAHWKKREKSPVLHLGVISSAIRVNAVPMFSYAAIPGAIEPASLGVALGEDMNQKSV